MGLPSLNDHAGWIAEFQTFKRWAGKRRLVHMLPKESGLARWIRFVRSNMHRLTDLELTRLVRLGFDFGKQNSWVRRYLELAHFKRKHGHLNVPTRYSKDPGLNGWTGSQRHFRNSMTADKKQLLSRLGFNWKGHQRQTWEAQFQKLLAFRKRFGHCNVPITWKEDRLLASWVGFQRIRYRHGKLERYRQRRLEEQRFQWSMAEHSWWKRFNALRAFHQKHGHSQVSNYAPGMSPLYQWIAAQRHLRRQGKLLPYRKRLLDSMDISWGQTR